MEDAVDADEILSTLNEPIVNELFIQIVNIIEFFCKGMAILDRKRKKVAPLTKQENLLMKCYDKVCERMDEAQREAALFNCLKIPND